MTFKQALINIQNKYNYDNEMMEVISNAFLALTRYYKRYGNYSNKIYKALMETRIITYSLGKYGRITEEKERLMEIYSDKEEEGIRNNIIAEDGELLYKIIGNKVVKTIIIKKENGKISLETLIHELIHAIVTSDEVIDDTYFLSGITIEHIKPIWYTYYNNVEEGLAEYDTVMSCHEIGYDIKPTESYKENYDYIKPLMDNKDINMEITKSRLNGIKVNDINLNQDIINYITNYDSICTNSNKRELIISNREKILRYLYK